MISDVVGRQLHDRASRGGSLSANERQQLEEWLLAQDHAESNLLSSKGDAPTLADLRSQVDVALEKVAAVTRNIRQLSEENDVCGTKLLRCVIAWRAVRPHNRHDPAGGHPRASTSTSRLRFSPVKPEQRVCPKGELGLPAEVSGFTIWL
jgi:hypothetical protein